MIAIPISCTKYLRPYFSLASSNLAAHSRNRIIRYPAFWMLIIPKKRWIGFEMADPQGTMFTKSWSDDLKDLKPPIGLIPLGAELLQLPSGQLVHHILGTAWQCRTGQRGGFGRAEPIEGTAGAAVVQATWRGYGWNMQYDIKRLTSR